MITTPPLSPVESRKEKTGRSSGSGVIVLTTFPVSQWRFGKDYAFTAAGPRGICTRFPFHRFSMHEPAPVSAIFILYNLSISSNSVLVLEYYFILGNLF
jgi:hypothetical protein